MPTSVVERPYQAVDNLPTGQGGRGDNAVGRVALRPARGPAEAGAHDDALHAVSPLGAPREHCGDEVGDPARLGEALGLLHEQAGHGCPAAGAEVTRHLVGLVEADDATRADHVVMAVRVLAILLRVLGKLGLEFADFALESDDVGTADALPLGAVVVLAGRA